MKAKRIVGAKNEIEAKRERKVLIMCNKRTKLNLAILLMAVVLGYGPIVKAGNLEPSASPAPTMKTLDEVEPRIPISSLPYTISNPGSYYVTGNLISDANGIVVDADDVTIDLMGYSLKGSGDGSGVYAIGETRRNIEIRNGTLQNFMAGIVTLSSHDPLSSSYSSGIRIINVRIHENASAGIYLEANVCLIKDSTVTYCSDAAIHCGHISVVTGNSVLQNNSMGIKVGVGSTVKDNTVVSNSFGGISVSIFCKVTGNIVTDCNSVGIYASDDCIIADNIVTSNGNGGIMVGMANIVTGNTLRNNAGDDINIDSSCKVTNNLCKGGGSDSGIHARGSGNRIEANNVSYNAIGIDVDSGFNLIIKNSAGNNTTHYDIAANNSYGPIVNVAGVGDI